MLDHHHHLACVQAKYAFKLPLPRLHEAECVVNLSGICLLRAFTLSFIVKVSPSMQLGKVYKPLLISRSRHAVEIV